MAELAAGLDDAAEPRVDAPDPCGVTGTQRHHQRAADDAVSAQSVQEGSLVAGLSRERRIDEPRAVGVEPGDAGDEHRPGCEHRARHREIGRVGDVSRIDASQCRGPTRSCPASEANSAANAGEDARISAVLPAVVLSTA